MLVPGLLVIASAKRRNEKHELSRPAQSAVCGWASWWLFSTSLLFYAGSHRIDTHTTVLAKGGMMYRDIAGL
jgi:hypothetical protein